MKNNYFINLLMACYFLSLMWISSSFAAEQLESSLPSVLQQKVDSARYLLSRVPKGTTNAELADVYGKIGMYYQAGNQVETAILNYNHAFELDENNPKWMYLLAFLLQQQGQTEDSYGLYRRAFEKNKSYVPTLLRIAQLSLDNQKYEESKSLYKRLSKIPNYEASANEGLGQIALKQGDFDAAIKYFQNALQQQPAANRNYYYLAQAYKKKGDKKRAKEALQKRGETSSHFPDPLLNYVNSLYATGQQYLEKGIQQIKAGDYKLALKTFNEGLSIEPDNLTLKTALGRALEYLGESQQAESIYKDVLNTDGTNNIALFNLAALYDAKGNDEAARTYYKKTLEVQNDNLDSLTLLSSLEFRLGDFKSAEKHFIRMLALNPNLYDARVYLGITYLAINQCKIGSKVLWGALKLKPSDGNVALVLSVAEAKCKKNPKAWNLVNEVYQAAPGLKSARFAALVAGYLGKFPDAVDLQRQAMFEALKDGGLSAYPDLQINLKKLMASQKPLWSWKSYAREISPLPPIRTAE
jgi:tetratricopeptide (TPR) repeat protein